VEKHGTAEQTTDDNIIRRMRFACWITKATDTHSEYVILIAFPRQQWLGESASLLRLYVYFLFCSGKVNVKSDNNKRTGDLLECGMLCVWADACRPVVTLKQSNRTQKQQLERLLDARVDRTSQVLWLGAVLKSLWSTSNQNTLWW
jgi:hypothetical protein